MTKVVSIAMAIIVILTASVNAELIAAAKTDGGDNYQLYIGYC